MVYISPTINILSLSIRKIGRRLLRDFNEIENLQNSVKGTYTFLVKTKFKLKKVIQFELNKIKGNLYVFFLDEKPNIINENAWIVDTINGSENFQKGIPHFCISISLMENKEIKISVIYDPIKDELYYAQKEKGAYLNDFRLKDINKDKLYKFLREMEFNRLLSSAISTYGEIGFQTKNNEKKIFGKQEPIKKENYHRQLHLNQRQKNKQLHHNQKEINQ